MNENEKCEFQHFVESGVRSLKFVGNAGHDAVGTGGWSGGLVISASSPRATEFVSPLFW